MRNWACGQIELGAHAHRLGFQTVHAESKREATGSALLLWVLPSLRVTMLCTPEGRAGTSRGLLEAECRCNSGPQAALTDGTVSAICRHHIVKSSQVQNIACTEHEVLIIAGLQRKSSKACSRMPKRAAEHRRLDITDRGSQMS